MKSVLITKSGPPDVMRLSDGPLPEPGAGQVRVRVGAVGVNFADIMGRLGIYPDAPKPPYVPGYEVAGTVEAVGPGVDAGLMDQDVIALTAFGGYAEVVCVPAAQVFPRPPGMTIEQAAGFGVSYLTAYMALVVMAGLKRGEKVLIHAAAGGVGLAAVDIARIHEAVIFGTASPGKHAFLRECGVQYPIDYRSQDFEREIKRLTEGTGVQVALDSIGGRSWLKSYRSLGRTGRLVICGVSSMAPSPRRSLWALLRFAVGTPWLAFTPVRLANDNKGVMGLNLAHLWDAHDMLQGWVDQLLVWYAEGWLQVHIDRVFKLEEAAEAHRYIQARKNTGRVLLVP